MPRPKKIVRFADLYSYVGLRKTEVYGLMARGKFPKAVKLTERAVGWFEDDLIKWQKSRIAATQKKA